VSSADEVAMVKARIAAGPLNAHDSQPTAPDYPYVVLYADGGIRTSDREADVRVQRNLTWQTTTVGTSAAQCRAALDRLNDQLEDWRPTPANGRVFSKVEHTGSQPVRVDAELADRVVYYATDQWRMVSDPV
jgi:hypothetical protein